MDQFSDFNHREGFRPPPTAARFARQGAILDSVVLAQLFSVRCLLNLASLPSLFSLLSLSGFPSLLSLPSLPSVPLLCSSMPSPV